ncbi:hemagglutinin repeat-containing protein [Pseudomonas sp. F1_0610]|uniref:hemagglutinin repeat-containing protein n=1 Tax=Pseudomonas sp. F1_0610 TaxID=3114284 RepID=UPI0039C33E51
MGYKTSQSKQESSYALSQQNNLTAGGNITLTSTEGDIHLQNTHASAKNTLTLDSAQHIVLESGQSQQHSKGRSSNSGASIGVGASVGAQTGVYAYAEFGVGNSKNKSDSNTYNQTVLQAI